MPRMTRAAMRILEDEVDAASVPLPTTPLPLPREERAPLSEVTANNREELIVLEVNLKPAKGPAAQVPDRRARKENIGQLDNNSEVLEDDSESTVSSAVEEACDALMKASLAEGAALEISDERDVALVSRAVESARAQLSPVAGTASEAGHEGMRDSFLDQIASRSPVKSIAAGETPLGPTSPSVHQADDSFVEQIVARTPLRPVARIEDSVEAMDVLDDSIEKVAESLHAAPADLKDLDSAISRPQVQVPPAGKKASATTSKPATLSKRIKPAPSTKATASLAFSKPASQRNPPKSSTTASRATTSKGQPAHASTAIIPTKATTPASKPASRPRISVSSTTRPPYMPSKSTKPATASTFTLPSAPISARLREQREARLAAQEAALAAKRNFKARPIGSRRVSSGPLVRDTAASRARMSLMHGGSSAAGGAVSSTTAPLASEPRISSMLTEVGGSARKRTTPASVRATRPAAPAAAAKHATIAVAKRSSPGSVVRGAARAAAAATTTRTMASRSKPAARPAITSATFVRSIASPSVTTPHRVATTAAAAATTTTTSPPAAAATSAITARGTKNDALIGSMRRPREPTKETERRAKEEAARKARVEAAERGRAASREWAMRMKARKAAAVLVKDAVAVEGMKDAEVEIKDMVMVV